MKLISVNWSEVSTLEGLQIIQTVSNAKNEHAMTTFVIFLVDLSKFNNGESIFYWLILEHLSDVIINRTNSKQRKKILEILTNLVQVSYLSVTSVRFVVCFAPSVKTQEFKLSVQTSKSDQVKFMLSKTVYSLLNSDCEILKRFGLLLKRKLSPVDDHELNDLLKLARNNYDPDIFAEINSR